MRREKQENLTTEIFEEKAGREKQQEKMLDGPIK